MRNKDLFFCFLFVTSFFVAKVSFADVVNPEYFTATCNPNEVEVTCSWSRSNMYAPVVDECKVYENRPGYRYLVGEGHTFGGSTKYCFDSSKATGEQTVNFYPSRFLRTYPLLLAITLLFEVPVFMLFGLKTKRDLLFVIFANLISTLFLYISTAVLAFGGIMGILLLEAGVIIIEFLILRVALKIVKTKRLVLSVIVVNLISGVIGTAVLALVSYYLLKLPFI